MLSGRHGLSIDNILNATVVLADGRIVQANKDENEDVRVLIHLPCLPGLASHTDRQLFFGIRGGGCNFGVVTEFTFLMHPIPPKCWGGFISFSMDQMEAVYGAMRVWQDTVQTEDEAAWIMSSTKPLGDGEVRIQHQRA